MKKNRYHIQSRRAFIDQRVLNIIIMLIAFSLFVGPLLFFGSMIMKVIALLLLINILPSLFRRGTKNPELKILFSIVLVLILFKRAYFIPIVIVVGLILINSFKNKPKTRDGSYRFTSSNNSYTKNSFMNTERDYKTKTTENTEPKDPFSYRKRESEIIDVEYEDWEPEPKSQTYTNPIIKNRTSMDYSYSGNISKEESSDSEESEDYCCDNNESYGSISEHNKQKVYIGSITKTIHQDSLNPGDNELSFICKLGDLNLIIDSRVETEINCSIKAGEITIGDENYNGINQRVKRSWSPTQPSNKRLKLNCEVGLGEIKIKHKKLY